jgi:transcriptional regulator with XRE-family HTH domain
MRCQPPSHDSGGLVLQQKHVDAICSEVAAILRAERDARNLSMSAIAERGGLSQQMVSYVERGMRKPTLDTLVRMTHGLEIDLADVLQRAQRAAQRRAK